MIKLFVLFDAVPFAEILLSYFDLTNLKSSEYI